MRVLDLNIPGTNTCALAIISCSFLLYMKKESELLACFRDITSGGDIGLSLRLLIPLSVLHCQLYFISARFCHISCFASKTWVSFSFFKEEGVGLWLSQHIMLISIVNTSFLGDNCLSKMGITTGSEKSSGSYYSPSHLFEELII